MPDKIIFTPEVKQAFEGLYQESLRIEKILKKYLKKLIELDRENNMVDNDTYEKFQQDKDTIANHTDVQLKATEPASLTPRQKFQSLSAQEQHKVIIGLTQDFLTTKDTALERFDMLVESIEYELGGSDKLKGWYKNFSKRLQEL